ncbi:MAG: hypothetical protein QNJ46_15065 [Leptolyngbyaceae cyanobacterium MO_188.B28]|nr:hypothetical protein [Leptolyngbyaceae cyanobacterium MO_188.B28]
MTVIICPGVHGPELTESCLQSLTQYFPNLAQALVFPSHSQPAFSPFHLLQFLQQQTLSPNHSTPATDLPLTFLSFSAGVAGAIGAASVWRRWGGQITAFIALDGWGVPLIGDFPIHRASHDEFTHWSSALLGSGEDSFYADPPVPHLDLWRSPHSVAGWRIHKTAHGREIRTSTTAAAFIATLLRRYEIG